MLKTVQSSWELSHPMTCSTAEQLKNTQEMPPKTQETSPKAIKPPKLQNCHQKNITRNPGNHWVLDRGHAQKPCVGGRLSPPCPSLSPPFTSTVVQLPRIAFTQFFGKTQGQKAARASSLHPSHCRAALRAGLGFQGPFRKTSSKGKQ